MQQPGTSHQTSTRTVILEIGEDTLAEEIQSGGINAADVKCGPVMPLLWYLDSKMKKYARPSTIKSYVELVIGRE